MRCRPSEDRTREYPPETERRCYSYRQLGKALLARKCRRDDTTYFGKFFTRDFGGGRHRKVEKGNTLPYNEAFSKSGRIDSLVGHNPAIVDFNIAYGGLDTFQDYLFYAYHTRFSRSSGTFAASQS
jgi:hypothetical protein